MTTSKARSRLPSSFTPPKLEVVSNLKVSIHNNSPTSSTHSKPKSIVTNGVTKGSGTVKGFHSRLAHWPTLLLSLLGYGGLIWLMSHYSPAQAANLPWSNWYAPFHVLMLWANWWLLSWFLLNTRWAWWGALALQCGLFLKLQQVVITPAVGLAVLVLFGTIGLSANFFSHLANRTK